MFRGRERVLLSIQRPVQHLSFFFCQSFPGDGDALEMLNAHCFHQDNTFTLYFLELFPLAVKPNLELCCIQLASHRQQRRSLNRPNKKSWIGHFTDEHRVPLIPPPVTRGYVNLYSLGGWRNAKHKIFKTVTHISFREGPRLVKDGDTHWKGEFMFADDTSLN